jgi:hypothetical protein
MQVKEAVSLAKRYIQEVFTDEKIDNIGLEEVEFDDKSNIWSITIGFSRPWDEGAGPFAAQLAASGMVPRRRDYKVVRIGDGDKKMVSVKNRDLVSE